MQQDQTEQAVHLVLVVFLLEPFLLEVVLVEVLVLEVVLEAVALDYHLLVVILETILFLKNNPRKNLVISRLRLPMHFCRGVFGASLLLAGIFRRVVADLNLCDPVHYL